MASRARLILVERMITFARCVIHAERSIFVGCTGSGIVAPELRTWRDVAYVRRTCDVAAIRVLPRSPCLPTRCTNVRSDVIVAVLLVSVLDVPNVGRNVCWLQLPCTHQCQRSRTRNVPTSTQTTLMRR